jgi:hypothetical protein
MQRANQGKNTKARCEKRKIRFRFDALPKPKQNETRLMRWRRKKRQGCIIHRSASQPTNLDSSLPLAQLPKFVQKNSRSPSLTLVETLPFHS